MTDDVNQTKTTTIANGNNLHSMLDAPDPGRKPWVRFLMQVLWPAFLGAAITVGFVFSMIDPMRVEWVYTYLNDSREAAYTVGFILLWILYAFACSMTWFLATTETPAGGPGSKNH